MSGVVTESGFDAQIAEIKTLIAGLGNVEKRELFTEMLEVVSPEDVGMLLKLIGDYVSKHHY